MNNRLGFGVFLAPHHPIGEHPTLQLQRDLELAEWLDELGMTNSGSASIIPADGRRSASPEMFLAAAAMVTNRIKLGTGVVSIPYHHPFNVAQRIVHARPSEPRPRDVRGWPRRAAFRRLHARHRSDDAARSDGRRPRRHPAVADRARAHHRRWRHGIGCAMRHCICVRCSAELPIAVASTISPAGMKCAGKYGVGVLSVGSYSAEGLSALKTQWSFRRDRREGDAAKRSTATTGAS